MTSKTPFNAACESVLLSPVFSERLDINSDLEKVTGFSTIFAALLLLLDFDDLALLLLDDFTDFADFAAAYNLVVS